MATELEQATGGDPSKLSNAVQNLIKEVMEKHDAIIFNGDGYGEQWQQEAERRGLPNLKTSADALPALMAPEVVELFEKYGVLSPRELESRHEVYLEQYCKTIGLERALCLEIGKTMIFPAAIRYQSELAGAVAKLRAVDIKVDTNTLDKMTALIKGLQDGLAALEEAEPPKDADPAAQAKHACHTVLPLMNEIRKYADALEELIADDLWPLPTYQEMLFIK
jgi:glutamine synthetase